MTEWNFGMLFDKLGDEAFERVKTLFKESHLNIPKVKENKLCVVLMNTICDDKTYKTIGRDDLAAILYSCFYNQAKDIRWLAKYVEKIMLDASGIAGIDSGKTQASRYYKRAKALCDFVKTEVNAPKCKGLTDETLDCMIDFIKIMMAIYNECISVKDKEMLLNVDMECIEYIDSKKFWDWSAPVQGAFPWITNKRVQTSPEERQLGIFLTEVIRQYICEQDGVTGGVK